MDQLFIHPTNLAHDLLRAPLTPILMQGGGSQKKGKKAFFSILLFIRANVNLILVAFCVSDECSSTLPIGVPMRARAWPAQ